MPTVTGLFADRETTESAVDHLVESGVDRGAIGVMWKDRSLRQPEEVDAVEYRDHHEGPRAEAAKAASGGAIGGAVAGAGAILLASAGVALVPGIGALLTAGTAAATAAAAAAGALGGSATGGLLGAVIGATDHGATKVVKKQTRYREAIERDGFIVTASVEADITPEVVEMFEEAGASDISVMRGEPIRRVEPQDDESVPIT